MRFGLAVLAIATTLGASRPAVRPSDTSAGGVKVMTFNIQHGITGANKYDLQRAIDTIAKAQPDLVGLQEVTRNHPYYNCDDQPAKIAAGLHAATGRTWNVVYEQEWFTPNVECQQSGRGDGKETEGLAFLSPAPLGTASMTPLPVSRIALSVKPPLLGGAAITVTHLASGKTNGPARAKEVDALLRWTQKLGGAQIVIGDFNLTPDEVELQPLLPVFKDAWAVARAAGTSGGAEGTHGDKRIDFIFYRGDALDLTEVHTLDTATWFGAAASDHRPLVGAFRMTRMVK